MIMHDMTQQIAPHHGIRKCLDHDTYDRDYDHSVISRGQNWSKNNIMFRSEKQNRQSTNVGNTCLLHLIRCISI